ncbi:UNVERIFIED_ORG: hypothetical protein J2Y81_008139 [Paraburkholderia sediminicola]|nr:hypothetical protein [Paraburkholderia sediminicola]
MAHSNPRLHSFSSCNPLHSPDRSTFEPGGCWIAIDGHKPIELLSDDFILISAAYGVAMSSLKPPPPGNGEFRIGAPDNPIDLRMTAGHYSFGSPDASLLVSLLPQFVRVRGEQQVATLVQLVRGESREQPLAREVVLSRLLEVLLTTLFYLKGMRLSEVAAGKMGNFSRRLGADGREQWRLDVLGKGDRAQRVPAVPELIAELARYRTSNDLWSLPGGADETQLVIPFGGSEPLHVAHSRARCDQERIGQRGDRAACPRTRVHGPCR